MINNKGDFVSASGAQLDRNGNLRKSKKGVNHKLRQEEKVLGGLGASGGKQEKKKRNMNERN